MFPLTLLTIVAVNLAHQSQTALSYLSVSLYSPGVAGPLPVILSGTLCCLSIPPAEKLGAHLQDFHLVQVYFSLVIQQHVLLFLYVCVCFKLTCLNDFLFDRVSEIEAGHAGKLRHRVDQVSRRHHTVRVQTLEFHPVFCVVCPEIRHPSC